MANGFTNPIWRGAPLAFVKYGRRGKAARGSVTFRARFGGRLASAKPETRPEVAFHRAARAGEGSLELEFHTSIIQVCRTGFHRRLLPSPLPDLA